VFRCDKPEQIDCQRVVQIVSDVLVDMSIVDEILLTGIDSFASSGSDG
jgi:hypothetical protein